jgi:hypothetical protein
VPGIRPWVLRLFFLIEAVEILPALVEHASLFSPGNHRYFDDPRI